MFLKNVPRQYLEGSWHPLAVFILLGFGVWLLIAAGDAERSYLKEVLPRALTVGQASFNVQAWRIGGGIYMVVVASLLVRAVGLWPLLSYTVTSWNILALRLLMAAAASAWGARLPVLCVVAQALRFPALVGACITVSVWWLVLVPAISALLSKEPEKQRGFILFNFSPLLLNVHLLNLPIAIADLLQSAAPLAFFDLWAGFVVMFLYIMMYLNYMDPMGLHFYIVFTPRTPWVVLTYSSVISLYYGYYRLANFLVAN